MATRIKTFIRLESDPKVRRVGSSVMWTAIVVGMCFMVLWLLMAVLTFQYNIYWSMIIAGAACAFATFLCMMAHTLIRDSKRRYVIEVTDSEVVLNVYCGLSKKSCTQMVLIDDIQYAEYYPYCDSSCMILHTTYAQMEIPLWPLGARGTDVIDYLIGRGVKVVNVQSDDPIPEFKER